MKQTNGWTEERKKRQSEIIRTWRPWECSTGPKTVEGKSLTSRNAFKGGVRPLLRQLAQLINEQSRMLLELS